LKLTLREVAQTFAGWSPAEQRDNCSMLLIPSWTGIEKGWDILDLREGGGRWKVPGCCTGRCKDTAEVDGRCYSIVGLNYVMFGLAWSLCRLPYLLLREYSFWYPSIAHIVDPVTAWEANLWAMLGYNRWPAVEPTESWRGECEFCRSMSEPYRFSWTWLPHH
jgi:hypothetical protein